MLIYKKKMGIMAILMTLVVGVGMSCFSVAAMANSKPYAGTTLRGIIGSWSRFAPLFGAYDGPPYGCALMRDFEKETGIKIEVSKIIFANLAEKQMLELTSPAGYASFLTVNFNWYPRFKDYLEPLNEYLVDSRFPEYDWNDVTEGGKKGLTLEDVIYGFPLYVYSPTVMFRKDLYAEAGLIPPKTWSGLVDISGKLTVDVDGDKAIDRYGITFLGKKAEIPWWPISCLYAFGGQILDEDMKPIIDNQVGVEAFETFCALQPYCPPGVLGNELDTMHLQFRYGKVAQYIGWPFFAKQIRQTMLPEDMIAKLGVFGIPGEGRTKGALVEGWGTAIPKNAPHKDAAYLFINWLSSTSTMRDWQFTRTSGPPALKSVLSDPEVIEANPEYVALQQQLKVASTVPRIPEWFEIQEALQTYYGKGFGGEITPEAAMHQAAKEIDNAMRKAGYYGG